MSKILDEIKYLKESAKSNRDFKDFDDAIEDLMTALSILKKEFNSTASSVEKLPGQKIYMSKLAHEISDCYGMAGGVYRRQGKLDKASQMYKKGASYEQNSTYEIQDSYNLSNSIVISILQDPSNILSQKEYLDSALKLLAKQVRGKRRDQWWAWADLGLLYLLKGDVDRAKEAYSRFKELGARLVDYQSSLTVLKELEVALNDFDPSISSSIEQGINCLNKMAHSQDAFTF